MATKKKAAKPRKRKKRPAQSTRVQQSKRYYVEELVRTMVREQVRADRTLDVDSDVEIAASYADAIFERYPKGV